MPDNINLIPSEVVKERSLKKTHSRLLLVSIFFLVLVVLSAIGVIFLQSKAQGELNAAKGRINSKQDEIESLKEVERKASSLTAKLSYIEGLLSNKIFYSRIMNELDLKSKTGITLTQATVSESYAVEITGLSTSTTTLQSYINNLVQGPDNLFSDARILEVNIKEGSGLASFKVSVKVSKDSLVKSLISNK